MSARAQRPAPLAALAALFAVAALACASAAPVAEPAAPSRETAPAAAEGGEEKKEQAKPAGAKATPELVALYDEWAALRAEDPDAYYEPPGVMMRVREDRVLVDFTAAGDGSELLPELEALGLVEGAAVGNMVSGWLPIAAIPRLEEIEPLRIARPSTPVTQTPREER